MGLKTTNYEVNGLVLPEAYAIFESADTKANPVVATFKIHSTRENASKLQPLERKRVRFQWDRNTNPVEEAYKYAKKHEVEQVNPLTGETETVEIKGVFDGWEDDIVTE
ncbi:MAG: hypothetical protein IJY05_03200 [Clostridia bacterium]|nr:hypothetical protein [Clostridia bacterium]